MSLPNNNKNNRVQEMDLSLANNQIVIDCENYTNNGDDVQINNGSSNMNTSINRSHSGIANSASAHTLFESTADNTSFRVVRSYREYAAQFLSDEDTNSDITGNSSDDTSVNDSEFMRHKKEYDAIYRNQSGTSLKNSIGYDIEKSKTVKSCISTTSSKTAYRNPTLSSVVNQNMQNVSFDKSFCESEYDDLKKLKKEHKDPQLKLQKMILNVPETYEIPTRDKKILSQRVLNATLVIMIIIATSLLGLFFYLKINDGYSFTHMKDISDSNRTAMVFIAAFMYLAVIIGTVGSALNWKSILLTYCIFCTLNALALGYLVYGVYDDAFQYSQLPLTWWDKYSGTTRRAIQDEFKCCGFKNALDGGEISAVCPKEAVVWNIPYELIYDNFVLMKKDACAQDLNVTIIGKKDKNKTDIPTPNVEQVPVPISESTTDNQVVEQNNNENTPNIVNTKTNGSTSTTTTTEKSTSTTTTTAAAADKSVSTTDKSASTTAIEATATNDTTSSNTKRSIEIVEDDMELWNSPLSSRSIYNILNKSEIEEEDDGRDDKLINNIRVLNKREVVQETANEYQARVNSTNPEIDYEAIKSSNYTSLTPQQSKEYAVANGIEGCELKLQEHIHKHVAPVFYVLLLFFGLYVITIPMALIFLFKLRRIPSINEFE